MKSNPINEEEICRRYIETNDGIAKMAEEYHVNKDKIKKCLLEHGIEIKKKGKQPLKDIFVVNDWKIEKYPEKDGVCYVAVDKETGYECNDVYNRGGHLTTYIEQKYGVPTPTLYDRRLYYMRTGNYWWEQWFTIEEHAKKEEKKCAYCEWVTNDVENKSGAYEVHLKKAHGLSKLEHLKKHPEDKKYFELVSPVLNRQMSNDKNDFLVCQVCGKKLGALSTNHLRKHGLTQYSYLMKYGLQETVSKNAHDKLSEATKRNNMNATFHKTSKPENEIADYVRSLGFVIEQNTRKILEGKEIDIYIPSLKIGIEFNGLLYHTEDYGKKKYYHQEKTNIAESKGIKLYQIFEDEYVHKKEIVLSKIRHILQKDEGVKINARDCFVKEITENEAMTFLDMYHIQGFGKYDTIYLGAFNKETLVGVMTFTEEEPLKWNLTRFATNYHYNCRGVGGKLFKHFVNHYKFDEIKSFADRRWTSNIGENLYDKIGFTKTDYLQPNYTLFINKNHQIIRFHRSSFRKASLIKLFGFDEKMTGEEMLSKLGYKRIWDCGLIKYVYRNPNVPQPETSKSEAQ